MQAFPDGALAYFNCGPVSGASQPHKHVQVVPLPLADGCPEPIPTATIIERALADYDGEEPVVPVRQLPFQAFASQVSDR